MKTTTLFFTALMIASVHQILSGETSGDWAYSVTSDQATITGYSGTGVEVEIPASVNEMAVVKVGGMKPLRITPLLPASPSPTASRVLGMMRSVLAPALPVSPSPTA